MNTQAAARRFLGLVLALAGAAGTWAQPAPAPAAAPTPTASAAAASNPLLILPQWAQDKVLASRSDPKVLDQAYKQGAKLATFCANCHGPSGHSLKPEVPNLAGQNTVYVLSQLIKFHEGKRKGHFFMEGLVKAMSNDERFAVAVYYTSQDPKPMPAGDPALVAKGKAIYDKGCKKCHGTDGYGNERNARIAGQQPEYMKISIGRYRDNNVRADDRMYKYTKSLTDDDIKALVTYIGSME